MRQAVKDVFLRFSEKFEGSVAWMYLDVKGLVSTGIGNLIDAEGLKYPPESALNLPWKDRRTGQYVNKAAIALEWMRLKDDTNGEATKAAKYGHLYLKDKTFLRLDPQDIEDLVSTKRDEMWSQALHYFPKAEEWPADAQLGLMSLVWACGPHFSRTWPKFTAAANSRDWNAAAAASHMNEAGNPGLIPRNKANLVLFTSAALNDRLEDSEIIHYAV